jgi:peroxiredoxin Q/BCP
MPKRFVTFPRVVITTLGAIVTALVNLAKGSVARSRISLQPGDEAPDFALKGSDRQTHRLHDAHGHDAVVLAWFPKAFTGGCTVQCEAMGVDAAAIRSYKVRHFGISVDKVETIEQFAEALGVDYPILSDADGSVARAYGVLGRAGFPARVTFFIGSDGRILHIDRAVHPSSHGRDILARLGTLGIARH